MTDIPTNIPTISPEKVQELIAIIRPVARFTTDSNRLEKMLWQHAPTLASKLGCKKPSLYFDWMKNRKYELCYTDPDWTKKTPCSELDLNPYKTFPTRHVYTTLVAWFTSQPLVGEPDSRLYTEALAQFPPEDLKTAAAFEIGLPWYICARLFNDEAENPFEFESKINLYKRRGP